MLQYLLNATAIWLLSLLVFDLFLRRETFHSYNRIYLLGTFLLGIFLPLWSWQSDAAYDTKTMAIPAEKAIAIKQQILDSSTAYKLLSWEQSVLLIYCLGVAISIVLLLKEIRTIITLFKKGRVSKDGVWTIVETGKEHSPFSAFRYIFICSRENYSEEQLRIILTHEEQHGHALHFIDLILMQIGKIVFWFHPLVYIYQNRLMIVHEFQADKAVPGNASVYGQFLVEQSMLQSAPVLSHSFNRSPIKKRILMLTRKSSSLAKSKMLLVVPLVLVSTLCFTKNAISGDKKIFKGNTVTYKGNVFELSEKMHDTIMVEDPVTGKMLMKIAEREPQPIKMNGQQIYDYLEVGPKVQGLKLREYFRNAIMDESDLLIRMGYNFRLFDVVIDEKGRVVYYTFSGLYKSYNARELPEKEIKRINKKIETVLKDIEATPAMLDGKPVPYLAPNLGN